MKSNEEYNIITEVGVFGDLNIEDPTVKKVKNKDDSNITEEELQTLINESITNNASVTIQ